MGSVLSILNFLTNQMIAFFRQEQPKEVNFNSLPAKVVVDIFSRMTPTELLATERVDRNWQRLVRETLEKNVETVLMKPLSESYIWSLCHHWKNKSKKMLFEKMFDHIINKKRKVIEEALAREYKNVWFWEGLQGLPQEMQLLTSCLSKLGGVRSIDLSELKVSVQTLAKVFEVCPKLECITINGYFEGSFDDDDEEIEFFDAKNLNEDDWIQFINSFGHRLVHLKFYNFLNCERLFNLLGNYSNNLHFEMIGFSLPGQLTEQIVTTIQQLQKTKNVYVMVLCKNNESVSIELIDEILCVYLHWNSLPDHCQRLSLLRFGELGPEMDSPDQFKSVDFTGLKTLDVYQATELFLQVLIRCHFPVLENLKLTYFNQFFANEVDQMLGLLFEKMPNLVKFLIQFSNEFQYQVPGPSILLLNSLTELICHIVILPDWDIQVMVNSFDVIGQLASLKKLSFAFLLGDLLEEQLTEWRSAIEQQSAALRNRRPELVVEIIYDRMFTFDG